MAVRLVGNVKSGESVYGGGCLTFHVARTQFQVSLCEGEHTFGSQQKEKPLGTGSSEERNCG